MNNTYLLFLNAQKIFKGLIIKVFHQTQNIVKEIARRYNTDHVTNHPLTYIRYYRVPIGTLIVHKAAG